MIYGYALQLYYIRSGYCHELSQSKLLTTASTNGSSLPQDFWERSLKQEHQGRSVCADREELCQSQVEGNFY